MKILRKLRDHFPNSLTVSRIAITPFIFAALVKVPPAFRFAFFLFVAASLSDFFDGFFARKWGRESSLGALLDPLADKILLTVTFVTLSWIGLIPLFLTIVVLLRDAGIVLGVLLLRLLGKSLPIQPIWLSKWNTVLQMVFVAGSLLGGARGWTVNTLQNETIFQLFIALTVMSTIVSGLSYAYVGWKIWRN